LPKFALPRYIEILPALPKTPTEKVRKGELRATGVTAITWDREHAGAPICVHKP
jgi:crotonobetaine/carnitine-CoA ligase